MALDSYANLQAAIVTWVNRPGDTDLATHIPDMIAMCEAQMNRRLRVRQMITRAEASISTEFSALPTDFLEPIGLTIETSEADIKPLTYLAPERLVREKDTITETDEPHSWSVVGSSLQALPTPDQAYTAELTYYAKIPALSNSNTSNWVLAAYPDAYLYGTLVQAAPFIKDDLDRLTTWGSMFQAALNDIQAANRIPAGKLRTDLALLVGGGAYNITTDL